MSARSESSSLSLLLLAPSFSSAAFQINQSILKKSFLLISLHDYYLINYYFTVCVITIRCIKKPTFIVLLIETSVRRSPTCAALPFCLRLDLQLVNNGEGQLPWHGTDENHSTINKNKIKNKKRKNCELNALMKEIWGITTMLAPQNNNSYIIHDRWQDFLQGIPKAVLKIHYLLWTTASRHDQHQ